MFRELEDLNRADWPLLRNGAVNLFWCPEVLDEARAALRLLDYEVAEISCQSGWSDFATQMSSVLRWQDQFGYAPWTGNLDAFNDGLRGYPFAGSNRAVIILRGFNALVEEDPEQSRGLLDVLEASARDHLLWSRTLIVLVQTDDNRFESGPTGARAAQWNEREWLNANRGL